MNEIPGMTGPTCIDCGHPREAPGVPAICAAWHKPMNKPLPEQHVTVNGGSCSCGGPGFICVRLASQHTTAAVTAAAYKIWGEIVAIPVSTIHLHEQDEDLLLLNRERVIKTIEKYFKG